MESTVEAQTVTASCDGYICRQAWGTSGRRSKAATRKMSVGRCRARRCWWWCSESSMEEREIRTSKIDTCPRLLSSTLPLIPPPASATPARELFFIQGLLWPQSLNRLSKGKETNLDVFQTTVTPSVLRLITNVLSHWES